MNEPIALSVRRLSPDVVLPAYARVGDAGLDLSANSAVTIPPAGGRVVVPTGIAVAIPLGFAGFVLPRSGAAAKRGLSIVNTPGLIDAGYRGELLVTLINTDPTEPIVIDRGDRIAQLVVMPVPTIAITEVSELPPSPGGSDARGSGGLGSTGR